jgi:DNA-binding SARP family transcriptional activator
MIGLRLLGPVDLRGPDGSVLRTVLAQPKRLALLAYLAAATPNGFHSRDTLLALLWPESDQEHARAALRQSVYVLRRELGDDVFVGCGDSALGVDLEKLWCDVDAFDRAAAAGQHAAALDLYRGQLLEGFHVSASREFERWIDRARVRLAGSAAALAWRLTEIPEATSGTARTLDSARRLLDLCPDDECAVRRAVCLLHRVGDRAGAIRVYEEFTRRIAQDYGIEPSAETRALVSLVRAGLPLGKLYISADNRG